ncbi:MAG: hypothetical protein E7212_10320 [Clostridium sartagoforme]|nr:hypothetical protein [Clostridium sartagoforme]
MRNEKESVVKLFNSKFNLQEFINFTQALFKGNVRYKKSLEFSPKIKREFNTVIESFLDLGLYKDSNRKTMVIVVVKLKKEESVARSRTIQRNFVKDYFLKGGVDSALVVFYNEKSEDWRLSFIKLDYSYKNSKLEEEITPAKRFSFLLGKNENHHTAVERFLPLVNSVSEAPTIEDFEETFNIEVVTKEFFEKYCDLYLKIKKELDNQSGFEEVAKEAQIRSDEFAKKLMGQLVFLYFLQKKGWLGVEANPSEINREEAEKLLSNKSYDAVNIFEKVYRLDGNKYIRQDEVINVLSNNEIQCLNNIFVNTKYDAKWGSGDKNFIRSMFSKANNSGKNFFKDYLEQIFYNALNDKRGGDTYFKYLNCKIPFLNGGLFQPISDNYDYKNALFSLDNSLFSNTNKTKQADIGDGVLDIFDRYAFTIKEDEPLEKEVAVDPEMLGKVFENLLDVNDRKKKGAFYTPREIVHYMCQESLINYLITEIKLSYDEAEALIRYGDIITDIDTSKSSTGTGDFKMPLNVRKQAKLIDNALENVKVADPAVGSGAFPLGMVNEIVRARMNLTYYILDDLALYNGNRAIKGRTPYELKLKTIRRCIHAVDIEKSAVDITKLRLWLALVVEENDFRNIKSLPNLDYNIMVGNSLIEEFEGVKLFNESLLDNKPTSIEKRERLEQLSLLTGIQKNENLLEIIYQLERRLEGVTDKIEAYNIQKELEEVKKTYNETAASIDIRKESDYILDEIYNLQERFFDANSKDEKISLKKNIDNLEWLLIEKTVKENSKEDLLDKIKEFKRTNTKPYFLWKLNFARVFKEKKGFDIIIGNPPYVGEKGNKEIFRPIANSEFGKKFYQGKMDLFYFFFHKAIDISNSEGQINFITTNYFITATGGNKLREDIKRRTTIKKLINFNEYKIFESAKGQHNMITMLEKGHNPEETVSTIIVNRKGNISANIIYDILYNKDKDSEYNILLQSQLYDGENNYIRLKGVETDTEYESNDIEKKYLAEILLKLKDTKYNLGDICYIKQGIVSGADKVTDSHIIKYKKNWNKGDGIFVLSKEEIESLELNDYEKKLVKNFYKNSQIIQYGIKNNDKLFVLYIDKNINEKNIPNIIKHLEKYKDILVEKREYKQGKLPWYALNWARDKNILEADYKIVNSRRAKSNIFALETKKRYEQSDIMMSVIKQDYLEKVDVKYLLGFLNSKLCNVWLLNKGKMKGNIMELYGAPLMEIPIKIPNTEIQQKVKKLVDEILETKEKDLNANIEDIIIKIDDILYEFYKISLDEKIYINKE